MTEDVLGPVLVTGSAHVHPLVIEDGVQVIGGVHLVLSHVIDDKTGSPVLGHVIVAGRADLAPIHVANLVLVHVAGTGLVPDHMTDRIRTRDLVPDHSRKRDLAHGLETVTTIDVLNRVIMGRRDLEESGRKGLEKGLQRRQVLQLALMNRERAILWAMKMGGRSTLPHHWLKTDNFVAS